MTEFSGDSMVALILQVGAALIVTFMAGSKGYSVGLWFFAGLLFPYGIAPIISIGLVQDINALAQATGTSPDLATLKRGNGLAWSYIRMGIMLYVGFTVLLLWMNSL